MKLVDYICDELEELERKAEKDGKLSMAEIQYMDTLAHAKKNLLKGEEMMEGSDYSMNGYRMGGEPNRRGGQSQARGRNAKRDRMGRYSSERRPSYDDMSYANDLADSIYDIMDELPEDVRRDAQKLVKKIESM